MYYYVHFRPAQGSMQMSKNAMLPELRVFFLKKQPNLFWSRFFAAPSGVDVKYVSKNEFKTLQWNPLLFDDSDTWSMYKEYPGVSLKPEYLDINSIK